MDVCRERGRTLSAQRAREHERSLSRLHGSPPPSVARRPVEAGAPRGRSRDSVRARSPPPPAPTRAPYSSLSRDFLVPPTRHFRDPAAGTDGRKN
eukprot:scaffold184158_cov19-Tisochrysis_lutea.AAC.1